MRSANLTTDRRGRRRGVTLIEMLVVVALVVLMMLILSSIFQAATGAISSSRTIQELDNSLRFLDMTIREDLQGVTARMTPPNDPTKNQGYFTYGENAPADIQGEDTDDYLAFTCKAPEGKFFTGRVWIPAQPGGPAVNHGVLPQVITSQTAEVIYFLRNGNLYRRVLLVVPERKGKLAWSSTGTAGVFDPEMFSLGGTVASSWMSVNDISARMSVLTQTGVTAAQAAANTMPVPNTLGDLTNRENRFASPRFCNDMKTSTGALGRDGIIDDFNADGIPDYYPTLTASQVAIASNSTAGSPAGLMNEDSGSMPSGSGSRVGPSPDVHAFPYLYPWMYTVAETNSVGSGFGWLHAFDAGTVAGGVMPGKAGTVLPVNHAPLEFGDSIPVPTSAAQTQSWMGFPTWRETASVNWHDPIFGLGITSTTNTNAQQARGLRIPDAASQPFGTGNAALAGLNMVPPLGSAIYSPGTPFGSDGKGGPTAAGGFATGVQVWEDDLLMTGVRSFDVKAIDINCNLYNALSATVPIAYNATYFDLGYASTDYAQLNGDTTLVSGTPIALWDSNSQPRGLGHEGRMPPLGSSSAGGDNRINPSRPFVRASGGGMQLNFVGDLTTSIPRLRRVWDSWSTDYTNAPGIDINLRGHTSQPAPLDRPIYPSYPPPYPEPLRGIQIQIRVVDPKNERVKILTIRQDFSDKL